MRYKPKHNGYGLHSNEQIPLPNQTMRFRFGELFCGPGGLALGAIKASVNSNGKRGYSIRHAWATDYDRDTCETYRRNICSGESKSVLCADIRNLNYEKLAEISPVDAMAFGFPCNDFSVVGEQRGMDGVYGPLYSYCVKALAEFKPRWFLAENVGGMRNANDGKAFDVILSDLFDQGYSLYPHLYKFEQYGVPQARHRIVIVGIHKNENVLFKIPSSRNFKQKSCREALENPPITSSANNHDFTAQSKQVVERLRHIKPGENAFTADIPESLRLKIGTVKISQIYKRLDPDKPAYTITGSGGGGTHMYHWKENRALTNRERARLQTFPDGFVFHGSKESVRKQIGMAVPPKGAKVIFSAILKSFAGVEYAHEKPSMQSQLQDEHLKLYNLRPLDSQSRVCDEVNVV